MKRDPVTVGPETPTLEAIELMRTTASAACPWSRTGRLVGIVTESDFMDIARELLEQKLPE